MNITLNNQVISIDDAPGMSLAHILELQKIPQRGVGVALNNKVVPHQDWSSTSVHEGDSITVIRAICGG